jgi:hypothetical protein
VPLGPLDCGFVLAAFAVPQSLPRVGEPD